MNGIIFRRYFWIKIKLVFNILFQWFKASLISLFLVLTVFSILIETKCFKWFIQTNKYILVGLSGLILFILIIIWKKTNIFWWRYKNTYKATKSKFTDIDYIFSIIFFGLIILVVSLLTSTIKIDNISYEIYIFLAWNISLLVVFLFGSYLWPHTNNEQKIEKQTDNLSDEPINNFNTDILNRKTFVEGLFNEINNLDIDESFVFGLYGKWGDGKSSILNLLRILINHNNKFLVVNFEPWNFKNEEAMLKAFFNTLEKELNKEFVFPKLKKIFLKYQKIISSGLNSVGINIDLGFKDETIIEVKEKIESYIEKTNKKLLIIIDEIDRLESSEIKMILKLVRTNSRFRNSIFILSLDNIKTISKLGTNGSELLKKIIQKPISLPEISPTSINNFLLFSNHNIPRYSLEDINGLKTGATISSSGYIEKITDNLIIINDSSEINNSITLFSNNKININLGIGNKIYVEGVVNKGGIYLDDPRSSIKPFRLSQIDILLEKLLRTNQITIEQVKFFDKEFPHLYITQISNVIENLRDAKIFLNSLYSSYPAIAKEVNLFDFVCLEVIKVFAKDIYEDIFQNWWIYVNSRFEKDVLSNPYQFSTRNENEIKLEVNKHIKDILEKSKIENRKKEAIKKILEQIFPKIREPNYTYSSERGDKRISTTSFIKYFTLDVPLTELPDNFIEDELKKWEIKADDSSITNTFIAISEQGKLVEFLEKIKRNYIEKLSKDLSKLLLTYISNNIKNFSRNEEGGIWDSEYNRGLSLVLTILNEKIEKKKILSEMKNILKETPDFLFAVDLVLTTQKNGNGNYYSIYESLNNNNNIKKIVSHKLENYFIVQNKNIFSEVNRNDWIRILYQWGSNWSDDTSNNKTKVTNYIVKNLRKDIKNYINLLKSFNNSFHKEEWDMSFDEYSKSYDLSKLKELADNFLKASRLNKEQKNILKIFVSKFTK